MKKWRFATSKEFNGIKGFNDIGDEFKDRPMYKLAKEICQNSLDTMLDENYDKNKLPIKVEFKEFWIKPSEIPGNENGTLTEIFKKEYEFNNNFYQNDKMVPEFYKFGYDLLNSDENIRCLRISDFNTTGLIGSENLLHSPWVDLTKNAGVSDKKEGSGGSKGKGKYSSFICSNLYTVFYSTIAADGLQASCGVSRLSGMVQDDNSTFLGEGYYEEEDNLPIRECLNLDKNFIRDENGTDVYIIGFRKNYGDWDEQMVASVIDTFFSAIYKGHLEVKIGDNYNITKESIGSFFGNEKINQLLEKQTIFYYKILESIGSNDCYIDKYSMFTEDDLILYLKKDDKDIGEINKVGVVRLTGMKVLDIQNMPKLGLYHGLLFMQGAKVNDFFRALENATHDSWSVNQNSSIPEELAKSRIQELRGFIRETIKKRLSGPILEEINATGVGETLPDDDEFNDENDDNKKETLENKVSKISITEKKPPKIENIIAKKTEDKEEINIAVDPNGTIIDNPLPKHQNNNPSPHPNPFDKEKDLYSKVTRKISYDKLRVMENKNLYHLILKTTENEKVVKLVLNFSGESGKEKVNIISAKCRNTSKIFSNKSIIVNENEIYIKDVKNNEILNLDIDIETDDFWSMEVNVYGNEQ